MPLARDSLIPRGLVRLCEVKVHTCSNFLIRVCFNNRASSDVKYNIVIWPFSILDLQVGRDHTEDAGGGD